MLKTCSATPWTSICQSTCARSISSANEARMSGGDSGSFDPRLTRSGQTMRLESSGLGVDRTGLWPSARESPEPADRGGSH